VVSTTRPAGHLLRHLGDARTTLITDRATALDLDGGEAIAHGRVTLSEPDTYHRSPACACCAIREDLIGSILRAARRTHPPERIVVLVDHEHEDLLTVVSTILSTIELNRRCVLDAVIAHVDAVESVTRLATGVDIAGDTRSTALAIADRVVIDGGDQVTDDALAALRSAITGRAGFARIVDSSDTELPVRPLDAWHGAPTARTISGSIHDGPNGSSTSPSTVVLRVDRPLDPDAIDEWLDLIIARHASRLLRLQGALSVVGQTERTCCHGVRSFAMSHSERDHPRHRSTESVLAICGLELDAEELTAGFLTTVAT
ncbi:MAG: GTP-binding protein, partial [Actinomycetota bacterium]